ncbi:YesL family protein [Metabacillus idriensis]|uniref:YesL family protein n=1 Tax=Metabacillus idriensis TaxID=324768 RepID=UPI003D28A2BB
MKLGGLPQQLYTITEWITRIFTANIIWLFFNLPIVYLTFNLFAINEPAGLIVNGLTIAFFAPFILFPATTALFGIVRKWVTTDSQVPLIRSYWRFYKENYVRSMTGGLIIVPLWIILVIDYFYFESANSPLYYVFLAAGMFMFVFTLHFFSNTVHFHLKLFQSLKNSMLLSLGKPVHTVGIAACALILFYISTSLFPLLVLLGLGSLVALAAFFVFRKAA